MSAAGFICFVALPAMPALYWSSRAGYQSLKVCLVNRAVMPVRVAITAGLMLVAMLPALAYLFAFFSELSIQLECDGAGCAQGGIALVLLAPLPWMTYLFVWLLSRSLLKQFSTARDSPETT